MEDNFWAESDSSIPGERKTLKRRCGLKWKDFHFRGPNRGRYDITQQRAVTVRRLASALFWFCPARKNQLSVDDRPENSNYIKTTSATDQATEDNGDMVTNIEGSDRAVVTDLSFTRTFTKKIFRRKCRPSLSNIQSLFEPYESFLKAVSRYYNHSHIASYLGT